MAAAKKLTDKVLSTKKLSLIHCGLTRVPLAATRLGQLDRLYMNDNAIEALPEELAALDLDVLGLMNNAITSIPDALEPRVDALYFGGNPGARAEKKRFDGVRKGFVMLG